MLRQAGDVPYDSNMFRLEAALEWQLPECGILCPICGKPEKLGGMPSFFIKKMKQDKRNRNKKKCSLNFQAAETQSNFVIECAPFLDFGKKKTSQHAKDIISESA